MKSQLDLAAGILNMLRHPGVQPGFHPQNVPAHDPGRFLPPKAVLNLFHQFVEISFANGDAAQNHYVLFASTGLEFLLTPWLSGFANYAYQEINQTYSGGVSRGGPRFKVNGGLRTEFDNGISGQALVHYVGSANYPLNGTYQALAPFLTGPVPDSRVGNYVLLNLRGAYRFTLDMIGGRNAEVAVTAFNALNDKHKEHPLGEKIGSLVMGWLTINY